MRRLDLDHPIKRSALPPSPDPAADGDDPEVSTAMAFAQPAPPPRLDALLQGVPEARRPAARRVLEEGGPGWRRELLALLAGQDEARARAVLGMAAEYMQAQPRRTREKRVKLTDTLRKADDLLRRVRGLDGADGGEREISAEMGAILWARQESDLVKGESHKYLRRVPTGNPRRPWRYFYSVAGGKGLGHEDELVEGAAFLLEHNGKRGHFHVIGRTPDGKITVRHDESGHTETLDPAVFVAMLHRGHAQAIAAHAERMGRDLSAVRQSGSARQRARLEAEAGKYGHTRHLVEAQAKDSKVERLLGALATAEADAARFKREGKLRSLYDVNSMIAGLKRQIREAGGQVPDEVAPPPEAPAAPAPGKVLTFPGAKASSAAPEAGPPGLPAATQAKVDRVVDGMIAQVIPPGLKGHPRVGELHEVIRAWAQENGQAIGDGDTDAVKAAMPALSERMNAVGRELVATPSNTVPLAPKSAGGKDPHRAPAPGDRIVYNAPWHGGGLRATVTGLASDGHMMLVKYDDGTTGSLPASFMHPAYTDHGSKAYFEELRPSGPPSEAQIVEMKARAVARRLEKEAQERAEAEAHARETAGWHSPKDRTENNKRLKAALKKITGHDWSVTGSTGTGYGWVHATPGIPDGETAEYRDGPHKDLYRMVSIISPGSRDYVLREVEKRAGIFTPGAVTPEQHKAQVETDKAAREAAGQAAASTVNVGSVVQIDGHPRRYLVTAKKAYGGSPPSFQLAALSGAEAGSAPSGVAAARVTLHPDQTVAFHGANAPKLRNKAAAHAFIYRADHPEDTERVRATINAAPVNLDPPPAPTKADRVQRARERAVEAGTALPTAPAPSQAAEPSAEPAAAAAPAGDVRFGDVKTATTRSTGVTVYQAPTKGNVPAERLAEMDADAKARGGYRLRGEPHTFRTEAAARDFMAKWGTPASTEAPLDGRAAEHEGKAARHEVEASRFEPEHPVAEKHREAAIAHRKAARAFDRAAASPSMAPMAGRLADEAQARSRDVESVAGRLAERDALRQAAGQPGPASKTPAERAAPAALPTPATPTGLQPADSAHYQVLGGDSHEVAQARQKAKTAAAEYERATAMAYARSKGANPGSAAAREAKEVAGDRRERAEAAHDALVTAVGRMAGSVAPAAPVELPRTGVVEVSRRDPLTDRVSIERVDLDAHRAQWAAAARTYDDDLLTAKIKGHRGNVTSMRFHQAGERAQTVVALEALEAEKARRKVERAAPAAAPTITAEQASTAAAAQRDKHTDRAVWHRDRADALEMMGDSSGAAKHRDAHGAHAAAESAHHAVRVNVVNGRASMLDTLIPAAQQKTTAAERASQAADAHIAAPTKSKDEIEHDLGRKGVGYMDRVEPVIAELEAKRAAAGPGAASEQQAHPGAAPAKWTKRHDEGGRPVYDSPSGRVRVIGNPNGLHHVIQQDLATGRWVGTFDGPRSEAMEAAVRTEASAAQQTVETEKAREAALQAGEREARARAMLGTETASVVAAGNARRTAEQRAADHALADRAQAARHAFSAAVQEHQGGAEINRHSRRLMDLDSGVNVLRTSRDAVGGQMSPGALDGNRAQVRSEAEALEAAAAKIKAEAASPPPAPDAPHAHALGVEVSRAQVNRRLAQAAHEGTSHVPEKRAEQEVDGYVSHMNEVAADLARHATTPEKRAQLKEELERYRDGYLQRFHAHLSARSRVISPLVTGPARFPVARNQKANATADKRTGELVEWSTSARRAIRNKLNPATVSSDRADAHEILTDRVGKLRQRQESMKAQNAIIRGKGSEDEKIARLRELGLGEAAARALFKPDFAGRVGWPDYVLKNNLAEIKRLEGRSVEVAKETSTASSEHTFGDVRVEDSAEDNRIRLFYPGKPDAETIGKLKRHGFRWSPSEGAWQRFRNDSTRSVLRHHFGMDLGSSGESEGESLQKAEPPRSSELVSRADALLALVRGA